MKPLIVAATRFEIQDSIPLLEQNNIPYVITGVGMTATAYALTKALLSQPIDFVINMGIAGAIYRSISIGEVVAIESDTFYELGAEDDEQFLTIDQLGFGKATYKSLPLPFAHHLKSYHGITVNKVHGCEKNINKLTTSLPHIAIESMEGAAAFLVCTQENIPCLQVRGISNYVEKRNKDAWNIPLALKNINSWLENFLRINKLIINE